MIQVKTEADRREAAIRFVKDQIAESERCISECDYSEDVNGERVYMPGCYADEQYQHRQEKHRWEIMLRLLTNEAPFSVLEW